MPLPPETKARRQREALLVSQYVMEQWPGARVMFQQRVGPIMPTSESLHLSPAERLVIGNFRRAADAVVILPDKLIVIEGYVHVALGKLSQLMTYLQLLPLTPELQGFTSLPIKAILLGAQSDPILTEMARRQGIEVVIYQPQWAKDYLATLAARFRRPRNANPLDNNGV